MNTPPRNRLLQIGTLAPAVLVLAIIMDVALRFIPMQSIAFRAWEALAVDSRPDMPFAPNGYYHNDHSFGDLANLANRPDWREYHSETFSTDAFGYRNPPEVATAGPPCAILAGSSFSAGCGVDDAQSLSAQLIQRLGCTVYSIAPRSDLESIRSVAKRLQIHSGVVFYEFLERMNPPVIPTPSAARPLEQAEPKALSFPAGLIGNGRVQSLMISRLEILAGRVCRTLQNDRFLPANRALNVDSRILQNGASMLFLTNHFRFSQTRRDASGAGAYWLWLAAELRRNHLSLCVFLVPEKAGIYLPFLREHPPIKALDVGYFDQIERQLTASHIPVVNLEPVFRQQAAEDFAHGSYLYRLDDTHWNPRGIALAADAIANAWRSTEPGVRSTVAAPEQRRQ